ncbi:hypothetical protein L600_001300000750 [Isoptericola variabilis J7]|nr:hypothetical protein L600_001300000750 [Isoptericola variabilis J7]
MVLATAGLAQAMLVDDALVPWAGTLLDRLVDRVLAG